MSPDGPHAFAVIDGVEVRTDVHKMSHHQDHQVRIAEHNAAAWLNLSHELRTPANAIAGHVELLLSGSAGPLSADMRSNLGEIQRAAATLTATIGEIVRLAEGLPAPSSGTNADHSERAVSEVR